MNPLFSSVNLLLTKLGALVGFLFISLLVLLSMLTVSYAEPKVIPNNPIVNVQQAKANVKAEKANPNSVVGKLQTANTELNTKNATLEQENNALQTQVNVLTQERSSQLFMTGAFIAIGGVFLGFIGAWLLLGRRGSDW